VAKYTYEHGLAAAGATFSVPGGRSFGASLNIETANGILPVGLSVDEENEVREVCVNMGQPTLRPKDIPANLAGDKIVEQPIEILGQQLLTTCVSMGNPHAVFFCDDIGSIELEKLGPAIENDSLFPNRINVHFVRVDGTGACAAAVAAVLAGRAERTCTAHLPGGDLYLNWSEKNNCVYMTGPAVEVFRGNWPDE